jgi:hypothetical protein
MMQKAGSARCTTISWRPSRTAFVHENDLTEYLRQGTRPSGSPRPEGYVPSNLRPRTFAPSPSVARPGQRERQDGGLQREIPEMDHKQRWDG